MEILREMDSEAISLEFQDNTMVIKQRQTEIS